MVEKLQQVPELAWFFTGEIFNSFVIVNLNESTFAVSFWAKIAPENRRSERKNNDSFFIDDKNSPLAPKGELY